MITIQYHKDSMETQMGNLEELKKSIQKQDTMVKRMVVSANRTKKEIRQQNNVMTNEFEGLDEKVKI